MKYIPADAAENLVLGQLRKLAVDDELLQQIADLANGSRDGELEELKKDRRSMRKRQQETDIKISSLISAIEAGTDPRSLQLRINELEDEKASLADEIEHADREIFVTETETVSAPVMAAEYKDLADIIDALEAAGDRITIRDLLQSYIEVIDWHQNADDPSKATAEMMLFEQSSGISDGTKEKIRTQAPGVTTLCVLSTDKLPREDSNL